MTGLYRTPRTEAERALCRLVGDQPFIANVSIRPTADIRPTSKPPRLPLLGPGVRFDMGERGPSLFGPGDLKRFFVAVAFLSVGVAALLGFGLWRIGLGGA
jgi:hypothetical protein